MKTKYPWYFPLEADELSSLWKEAILTLDANVLLDLYRYHKTTREEIIESLHKFEDRLWLSKQAADEFITNRKNVIFDANKVFNTAKDQVNTLEENIRAAIQQLKGNRILSDEIPDSFEKKIKPVIDEVRTSIDESLKKHPDFLKNDPILEKIAALFSDSVGDGFEQNEFDETIKEAERRLENRIPPGYMDSDKSGNNSYGDYLLWKEVLFHSKDNDKPIILVTSEKKEDWWDKRSGKIIGPRLELLKEAYEITGKRILIYQTLNFLKYATKLEGKVLNESTVEDIEATERSKTEITIDSKDDLTHNLITESFSHVSPTYQEGELIVQLNESIKEIKVTGNMKTSMVEAPMITLSLEETPLNHSKNIACYGIASKDKIYCTLRSMANKVNLPIGIYKIKFIAKVAVSGVLRPKPLFKVASEFNVSTQSIVDILSEHGYSIENRPNYKITPDMNTILEDYYLKEMND